MRISARFLLFFLLFASFFVLLSKHTFAQTKNYTIPVSPTPIANALNTDPNVDKNLHNGSQVIMIEVLSAATCQLTGFDFISADHKCLGVDPITHKIGFTDNGHGLVGGMTTMISYTFNPPASSTQYISYLKGNFGIVKPTYAAEADQCPGIGFCAIQPLLKMWVVMRNLAYLIFILIFVLLGLAIMLRIHIDPRTVMTVQNQIPKFIVGLVLVTFSFAISGFLIDVMYTASYLLGSVINDAQKATYAGTNTPNPNPNMLEEIITANSPFDAVSKTYRGGLLGLTNDGSTNFTTLVEDIFFGPPTTDSCDATSFQNRFCNIPFIGGILQALVGTVIGLITFLIIAVAVIYTLIKLWIVLVLAYINILLDIIFAPFWFLMGLLPGSEVGVGGWFKDMIANLAVYPATIAMLMLASLFSNVLRSQQVGTELFVPPVLGNPINAASMAGLISLGFFFMLPNVLTMMKGALKAPKISLGPVFQPAGESVATYKAGITGAIFAHTTKLPKAEEKHGIRGAILRGH